MNKILSEEEEVIEADEGEEEVIEGEEGAFIENNTAHSVPILLSELEKNSIKKENAKS